jgi:hypothetical protein
LSEHLVFDCLHLQGAALAAFDLIQPGLYLSAQVGDPHFAQTISLAQINERLAKNFGPAFIVPRGDLGIDKSLQVRGQD